MFLIRPAPRSDESFMGYVARLAERNDYDRPLWILRRSGISKSSTNINNSFVFNASTDLTGLHHLTGVSKSTLEGLLCPPVTGSQTQRQLFLGSPMPKHLIRLASPKMCPPCLNIANYHRKIWDLVAVTACPIHECFLINKCPGCRMKIFWDRKHVSICRCKYDWRSASTQSVKAEDLNLVKLIYKLCGLQNDLSEELVIKGNPLVNLNLESILMAV